MGYLIVEPLGKPDSFASQIKVNNNTDFGSVRKLLWNSLLINTHPNHEFFKYFNE
jgi:hypothetical protein